MGQGNFIMISFVRGFAPDSAHALPIAGFGQGSLLARNLTWGRTRVRTLAAFNDRGILRGECLSVWSLGEGPTSTSADLFNDREASTAGRWSLGRGFVEGKASPPFLLAAVQWVQVHVVQLAYIVSSSISSMLS